MAGEDRRRRRLSAHACARIYEQERLLLWMQEALAQAVADSGMKRNAVARAAGVVKSCITTALNSGSNLTLRTAASIAFATGHRLTVGLEKLPHEAANPPPPAGQRERK